MRTLAPVLLALASCSSKRSIDERINVPPFARYAERVVAASGAHLDVDRCGMFDDSRAGYCLLRGPAAEHAAFVHGLHLAPTKPEPVYGDQTCLALPGFGHQPGIDRLAVPRSLPPNTDNVRVTAIYAAADAICVQMEYPYG